MKKKTITQKITDINNLWKAEDKIVKYMPDREFYCLQVKYGEDYECDCDDDIIDLLPSVDLETNPDWLLWELEMME